MIRQFGGFTVRLTVLPYKQSYLPQDTYSGDKETKYGENLLEKKGMQPPHLCYGL